MTRTPSPQLSRHTEADGATPIRQTSSSQDAMAYTIREAPIGTPRRLRIVGVGAGVSGLNMIRSLRRILPENSYEFVIYEKNESVGGTWFENRYPGCRCDVPSHAYQFSWRKNPEWSNFCAPAAEINKYLQQTAEENDMMPDIKLSHKIIGALWDENAALWRINVKDVTTGVEFGDHADFLIDACGILNNWKWPEIESLHDFTGSLIHTANWPKDFDSKHKNIIVIGNGSSGVQVVPALVKDAKKVYHSIRTPTWILPPRLVTWKMMTPATSELKQIETDTEGNFSPAQIERFKWDSQFYEEFLDSMEQEGSGKFPVILKKNGPEQQWARAKATEYMTVMLGGDERLCKALIPTFAMGCRRLTPAPGYLEAMRARHVELVTDKIRRVLPEGVELVTGEVLKVDVIVCATGFDASFCPPFPIIGRNGNLQEVWTKETPKAYMSLAVAGMPNYFKFLGPGAPIAHGSVFTLSEDIADYIAQAIYKCQTEGIRTLVPAQGAVDDFDEHMAAFMPRTVFAGGCRSWYKAGTVDGPVTGVHPGSRLHFFDMLACFRGEDWEYTYDNARGNRFAYLGNGFSVRDLEGFRMAAQLK